jgi:hypothetical protein
LRRGRLGGTAHGSAILIDHNVLGHLDRSAVRGGFQPPPAHDARPIVKWLRRGGSRSFADTHHRSRHVAADRTDPGTNRAARGGPGLTRVGDAQLVRIASAPRQKHASGRQSSRRPDKLNQLHLGFHARWHSASLHVAQPISRRSQRKSKSQNTEHSTPKVAGAQRTGRARILA